MNEVFRVHPRTFIIVFLDDILVYSSSMIDHFDQVPPFVKVYYVVLNSIHPEGQGRQPPAVTAQPPATSCLPPQPPAAFTPPSTAAFTLEG
jgi:hypothetical protein